MELDKKTNILIVGLGLMGGSYAMALTEKGYNVNAITKNEKDIDFALKKGIINYGTTTVEKELVKNSNLIIFALYPKIFVKWIKDYSDYFSHNTVITDVTGVKGCIVEQIQSILPNGVEFIAAHPMAGRESKGVEYSDSSVFKEANYIVVPTQKNTKRAISLCKSLGETLGFADISELSAQEHDEMIAFLSQLTHCIAVSLMCANSNPNLVKYTGDSFRDLTRIANINDEMWSELFILNKTALLKEMESYRESFDKLYESVKNEDVFTMREMMRTSSLRRKNFERKK